MIQAMFFRFPQAEKIKLLLETSGERFERSIIRLNGLGNGRHEDVKRVIRHLLILIRS
jgi:hypothetical protein